MSSDKHPRAPTAEGSGRHFARTFAILLFLVGLGGFGTAAVADRSHAPLSAADEVALGAKDPASAAEALRASVTPVKRAFDSYAAASVDVASTRDDVNSLFNAVGPPSAPVAQDIATAKDDLAKGIAAYGAAIERERAAKKAYLDQLARLMGEMHR